MMAGDKTDPLPVPLGKGLGDPLLLLLEFQENGLALAGQHIGDGAVGERRVHRVEVTQIASDIRHIDRLDGGGRRGDQLFQKVEHGGFSENVPRQPSFLAEAKSCRPFLPIRCEAGAGLDPGFLECERHRAPLAGQHRGEGALGECPIPLAKRVKIEGDVLGVDRPWASLAPGHWPWIAASFTSFPT
ncbi:MAG TPA: hypothetical protein VKT70_04515 [Stellaceae bacterium]|nr:hypothetical protein [Stellaceae bacterium]